MSKQETSIALPFPEDRQLWKAFKSGDAQAYACIYQQHVRLLFHYGSKLIQDRDRVKDSIQDLFFYLWDRRAHLGETDHIRYYLFKALRRRLLSPLRKADIHVLDHALSADYHFKTVACYETDLIEHQSCEDHHQRLATALEKLPDRQKEAVFLKYYHELSFEEIACVMAVSKRSVYKLMHKAIAALQKSLLPILYSFLITFLCVSLP